MDYIILRNEDVDDLTVTVLDHIRSGWHLLGGVSVAPTSNIHKHVFAQALSKDLDQDKASVPSEVKRQRSA